MLNAGLVLEGGGLRGIYTAGVLDFLMDDGLWFENIYGVSAGACHGVSYVSRQRGRAVRTSTEYLGDRRYASFYSLLTTGDYFGVQFVYHDIPDVLIPFDYDAFTQSSARLYAVVTNCETGAAEYLAVQDLRQDMEMILASSSLPVMARIKEIRGQKYLDGGMADSIPLERSIAEGNKKNLVVLTQHRGYQKGPNKLMPLIRQKYRKFPKLVESCATRHERYNQTLDYVFAQEKAGDTFVLCPQSPADIGVIEKNKDRVLALYTRGYEETKQRADELYAFIHTIK